MDKNLENKLDQILEKVSKIDKIEEKLENYIGFSYGEIMHIKENMATKKDIQNLKLDLVDRYADKEKVIGHETRITNLEEKVFTN